MLAKGDAGPERGLSALGISTSSGAGISGFSAFMKGLVFLSCSEVAKSSPLPDWNIFSFAGADLELLIPLSISLKLGTESLDGSGALAASAGLSNVPPSLGKTGSFEANNGLLSSAAGAASGAEGAAGVSDTAGASGALNGLKAEIEESNSKSSNSSLNPSFAFGVLNSKPLKPLSPVSALLFMFSWLSLSLSDTDSALSPGLN